MKNAIRIGFSHMNFFNSLYPWERGWTSRDRIDRAVSDMREIGANAWRPQIHWGVVEPAVVRPFLRIEDVTDQMVEDYARDEGLGWSDYDYMVDACAAARIELHPVVGAAYHFQVPFIDHVTSGLRFLPSTAGRDHYLGRLFLHARGVVRRYRDRVGLWQIENELNAAGETKTFVRWRHGRMWWNWSFLTAVMQTLHRAVKTESQKALVSHNFQCDYRRVPGIWDWRRDVRRWAQAVDIVGVDRYPDYMIGRFSRGRAVARTVEAAKEVSGGKPVMIMEAGYPTAPSYRGFSEQGQVRYIESAIEASIDAGAEGFYYYNLVSPEGHLKWFQGNSFIEKIEPHWGLFRGDGSAKPGFEAFRAVCARMSNDG